MFYKCFVLAGIDGLSTLKENFYQWKILVILALIRILKTEITKNIKTGSHGNVEHVLPTKRFWLILKFSSQKIYYVQYGGKHQNKLALPEQISDKADSFLQLTHVTRILILVRVRVRLDRQSSCICHAKAEQQ